MRELVTSGLLVLLAAGSVEAQPQPAPATTGRDLLAAGDSLGAAEAFQASLRAGAPSRFTVQLAIYCDVSNLERQVRASGNPPELFVLRRSVSDRPCLGLYWGLFGSRDEARAAVSNIPGSLRASGQGPVALSAVLPPGEPAPSRVVAAPPPRAPVPTPAPAVPAPEAMPAAPAEEPVAPPTRAAEPVAAPPPTAQPLPRQMASAPLPETPSVRVPAMEIAAGYSYLWDDTLPESDRAYPLGWILSGCANLNRKIGVVGEVSAQYRSEDGLAELGAPFNVDLGLLGVHAGLRYTHRHAGFVTPYVQALAGVTRSSVDLADFRTVEDDFSIQPGAGVVVQLSDSVGLGLGGDYRLVFGEERQRNQFRFHADLVFGIGGR
ncbi:MAG TPA: hypothetical protein VE359_13095 [Vicinamibacteria bacterium]|nr:hypothetical protein [Vicinamibacteria bacterium]